MTEWFGARGNNHQVDAEENHGDDDQHKSHSKNEVHNSLELLRALVACFRRAATIAQGAHAANLLDKAIKAIRRKRDIYSSIERGMLGKREIAYHITINTTTTKCSTLNDGIFTL